MVENCVEMNSKDSINNVLDKGRILPQSHLSGMEL
jgi:hypothetical protein